MAVSLFEAASIGPPIDLAIKIDPSILISGFVGSALAFACFTGYAMLVARRKEYFYLGGLLSSGLSVLLWLQFASSIFGGSAAMFQFELLLFIGYIVIEKARYGDLNYVKHGLTLFTNFVAVFIRIPIIMLKNSAEKTEEKTSDMCWVLLKIL